eukprot:TRINITY_DN37387_c0_g1_i1.p1 TRINITY_DN37387_c0_g1~~TRINITY_DN37387_c0_g1_i1.p1  ORF type:complete len:324 (+),score=82.84 TRINITY_DN37387_c0_g1_i1:41-1012(+)
MAEMRFSFTQTCLLGAALWSAGAADVSSSRLDIQTIHIADPGRKNKTVSARLCMPSAAKETSKAWPLYIFGHGAVCAPEDYAYFCSVAVTALVFEFSAAVLDFNTDGLGKDAAFLAKALPSAAKEDPSSPLFQMSLGPVVLGGHSMGGGTAILAASAAEKSATALDGIALFAPGLYTLPSATPFLPDVSVPALLVSGSNDCGPNALPKQTRPAYDGLASTTKFLVMLKGANHCQWAIPTESFFGVCKHKECGHLAAEEQRRLGVVLAEGFFASLRSGSWPDFEAMLAAGENNGTWSFLSPKKSPGTDLPIDCPCQEQQQSMLV